MIHSISRPVFSILFLFSYLILSYLNSGVLAWGYYAGAVFVVYLGIDQCLRPVVFRQEMTLPGDMTIELKRGQHDILRYTYAFFGLVAFIIYCWRFS